MTEFYDFTDSHYYDILKNSTKVYCWKLELLDYQDAVIKEIVIDLDTSNSGSLSFSNQQGSCRTCSFTFTNPDTKYSIIENNPFWDRRRFKIYIGIRNAERIYWFSKGVYITQDARVDYHTITVQAVDKYGLLDGTLKVLPAFLKTTFKAGTKIGDIIRQILLQDIGNGFVLDAVEPIIDPDIANALLYRDYEMAVGSYYGDFLSELMNGYGCDIYYDVMGRLIVKRVFNDDIPYWYFYQGVTYSFSDDEIHYQEPNTNYEFDGVNFIIVETDNTETTNASYELGNHNPQSPICIEKVGYKAYDDGKPFYISAGDTSIDAPERKCKEYAEYMLLKQTCNTITKTFNAPIIPHLDTRQTIRITDRTTLEDGVVFLVTGLTIPFGVSEDASITATNIQWLLTDTESTSLTSERHNPETAKYIVSYSGTVKDADGNNRTFASYTDYAGGVTLLPSSGAGKGNYSSDLGFFNTTNIFDGWKDNQYSQNHIAGTLYTIPEQDVGMTPNWSAGDVGVVKCNISTVGDYVVKALDYDNIGGATSTPAGLVYLKTIGKYIPSKHSLFTGENVSITETGEFEIDYVFPAYTGFAVNGDTNGTILSEATEIDLSDLTSASSVKAGSFTDCRNLEALVFPPNIQTIEGNNTLSGCLLLTDITLPSVACTVTSPIDFMKNLGSNATPIEEFVIPSTMTFDFTGVANSKFLKGFSVAETLTVNCSISASDGNYPTLTVASPVDEVSLTGYQHYDSLDISANLSKVIIGANVVCEDWSGFGVGSIWDATIHSSPQTITGWFNNYSGSSLTIDSSSATALSNSFTNMSPSLSSFTVPPNVTSISGCFGGSQLQTLDLGNTHSASNSGNSLTTLETLTINSLANVSGSFSGLSSLGNLYLYGAETITSSFNSNSHPVVAISHAVQSITNSFNACGSLTTFGGLPSSDSYTGAAINGSFQMCPNLANVYLPTSVTTITGSFNSCDIATLNIPDTVTTISSSFISNPITTLNIGAGLTDVAFLTPGFDAISNISVSANNAYLSSENNCIYSKDKSILYFAATSGITDLVVNANTTRLSQTALWMSSIGTLALPASLTTIDGGSINANMIISVLEILNPTLDMTNIPFANVSKIRGYAGSTAETFAQTHNITFEIMT